MRGTLVTLTALLLAAPAGAGSSTKTVRPQLNLRATPRIAFSPALVLATAELVNGGDSEDYYCPAVAWDWDDGDRSAHESDCPAWQAGASIERRYTANHAYRQAGTYRVQVRLLRAGRTLSVAHVTVNVRPGAGDMTEN